MKDHNIEQCSQMLACIVDDLKSFTKDNHYDIEDDFEGHYVVMDELGKRRLLWKKFLKN